MRILLTHVGRRTLPPCLRPSAKLSPKLVLWCQSMKTFFLSRKVRLVRLHSPRSGLLDTGHAELDFKMLK
jgi:hypothetical protein